MSNNLPIRAGGQLPSRRVQKQVGRQLERLEMRAMLDRRADELQIDRISDAASHGQAAVAFLSATEFGLVCGSPNPLLEARVRAVTDTATYAIADVVRKAGR
jgi:hypothetical protein